MSATRGTDLCRRVSAGTPSIPRRRPRALWLLGAVALAIAPGMFLPSAAPASRQRAGAAGGVLTTPSGEPSTTSGESTSGGRAGGERRAGRESACKIELALASEHITAGEAATLSGTVACADSAQAAEQTVAIYRHTGGTPGSSVIGTVTPEASGAFHFTTEALEAGSSFDARMEGGGRSRWTRVEVAPVVTIDGFPEGAQLSSVGGRSGASTRAGRTVTVSGKVTPVQVGAGVVLQREGSNDEGRWIDVARGHVGGEGEYSITHTFGIPGAVNLRVLVRLRGHLPAISDTLSYQIARGQHARLTLVASSMPLTYGQPLSLSGVAAGPGGQQLTLLASGGGGELSPVASTSSEEDGGYSFTSLAPSRSTRYEVLGAHASSAVLFESVRPLLTPGSPPASVPDGEAVAFTGTLAPARGQQVYVQRQDSDGLGFHVVASGTVQAGGSFTIEHTLTGAGTQVYRIVVPAGAGLQAVASAPFDVQVTPAPEAQLNQQAPVAPLDGS